MTSLSQWGHDNGLQNFYLVCQVLKWKSVSPNQYCLDSVCKLGSCHGGLSSTTNLKRSKAETHPSIGYFHFLKLLHLHILTFLIGSYPLRCWAQTGWMLGELDRAHGYGGNVSDRQAEGCGTQPVCPVGMSTRMHCGTVAGVAPMQVADVHLGMKGFHKPHRTDCVWDANRVLSALFSCCLWKVPCCAHYHIIFECQESFSSYFIANIGTSGSCESWL